MLMITDGKKTIAVESILNWQIENALAQNPALNKIDHNTASIKKLFEKMTGDFQRQLQFLEIKREPSSHYLEDQTPEIEQLKR